MLEWIGSHSRIRNGPTIFEETQRIRRYSWKRAYFDCMACMEYMDKYIPRYIERFSFKSLCLPFAISVVLVVVSFMLTAHNNWHIAIALIMSAVFVAATFVIYFLYFHYLDYNMIFCDNRIEIYEGIWPGITSVINARTEIGDYTLPDQMYCIRNWSNSESDIAPPKLNLELLIDDENIECKELEPTPVEDTESVDELKKRFQALSQKINSI
ncbi:hypothetical protein IKF32_02260 [Candidatus Saccharibacteria bacterium]|nr:hypothetical protein [Candidatus Saccharibacteria bacterium]